MKNEREKKRGNVGSYFSRNFPAHIVCGWVVLVLVNALPAAPSFPMYTSMDPCTVKGQYLAAGAWKVRSSDKLRGLAIVVRGPKELTSKTRGKTDAQGDSNCLFPMPAEDNSHS